LSLCTVTAKLNCQSLNIKWLTILSLDRDDNHKNILENSNKKNTLPSFLVQSKSCKNAVATFSGFCWWIVQAAEGNNLSLLFPGSDVAMLTFCADLRTTKCGTDLRRGNSFYMNALQTALVTVSKSGFIHITARAGPSLPKTTISIKIR
jgi:hypothetical protein